MKIAFGKDSFSYTHPIAYSLILVIELLISALCIAVWYTNDIVPAFGQNNIVSGLLMLAAVGGCSLGAIGSLWIIDFVYLFIKHRKNKYPKANKSLDVVIKS